MRLTLLLAALFALDLAVFAMVGCHRSEPQRENVILSAPCPKDEGYVCSCQPMADGGYVSFGDPIPPKRSTIHEAHTPR